jgi:hypothetical protein
MSNLASELRRAFWPWRENSMPSASATNRYLLWIDSVGGFYLCTGSSIRIGQAVPGNSVELPLLADLSRHHATLRRTGESYVLDALRDVEIDGRHVESSAALPAKCELRLGKSLRMSFSRPHPLSATARLQLLTHHHTQPSSAGVVLMAETCILGPSSKCHVQCKNWSCDVVLYKKGDDLWCRTEGDLECAGQKLARGGRISLGQPVTGSGFSFSLEPLG